MRRSRVHRMVLATCLGSLLLVIFYFQSSLNPGACTPPSMLFYNKLLQISMPLDQLIPEPRNMGKSYNWQTFIYSQGPKSESYGTTGWKFARNGCP